MDAARRHGRADRPPRRLFARARAAPCTCSPRRSTSTAATASSARRCRSAPASPSPTAIASNDNVSLTYFGDGAANQGQVYESFNMAALWKLPVDLRHREQPLRHGHLGRALLGRDRFLAARPVLRHPRQAGRRHGRARREGRRRQWRSTWCRSGKGPIILEMQTYRYRGHSMSDPAKYRSKDEVQKMRSEHDPIEQVKARLVEKKLGERGRAEGDRQGGARHRRRRRRVRPDRSRAGRVRALDRHRTA